jgi:uncharacterized protein (TIGR03067 family)
MRARVIVGLIVLLGASVFAAPAPFPRPVRRGDTNEITLQNFQGDWKAISMDTVQGGGRFAPAGIWFQGVRVRGDRWFYMVGGKENLNYHLKIDGGKKPPTIDYYDITSGQAERPGMVGILRREGNRVTVLYYATTPEKRAKSFDDMPQGWWVLVLEREK